MTRESEREGEGRKAELMVLILLQCTFTMSPRAESALDGGHSKVEVEVDQDLNTTDLIVPSSWVGLTFNLALCCAGCPTLPCRSAANCATASCFYPLGLLCVQQHCQFVG